MNYETRTLAAGFAFPEGPRWHDGKFWFSDQHGAKIYALAESGAVEQEIPVAGRPSGLGWLPNGDLVVASMLERRLRISRNGRMEHYADLAAVHPFSSNDMVVDRHGRAYVGNIGFDFDAGGAPAATAIALVEPDGNVSVAADDLMCPNGTVITPDGQTLIVGESLGHRLTAFDVGRDGRLSRRRVFAELGEHVPDGICLDEEGCIWFASPYAGGVFRVREGGEIVDRVPTGNINAYACMLGGADGRDLFICCAGHHEPEKTVIARDGRIDIARVAAPRAGWP